MILIEKKIFSIIETRNNEITLRNSFRPTIFDHRKTPCLNNFRCSEKLTSRISNVGTNSTFDRVKQRRHYLKEKRTKSKTFLFENFIR